MNLHYMPTHVAQNTEASTAVRVFALVGYENNNTIRKTQLIEIMKENAYACLRYGGSYESEMSHKVKVLYHKFSKLTLKLLGLSNRLLHSGHTYRAFLCSSSGMATIQEASSRSTSSAGKIFR